MGTDNTGFEGIILSGELIEILFMLDKQNQSCMIQAIIDFLCSGETPEFVDERLSFAWIIVKRELKPYRKRISRKIKNRLNGEKGGRPRKDRKQAIEETTNLFTESFVSASNKTRSQDNKV